jgi:hypothetical protein
VHLTGHVVEVTDPEEVARITAATDAKYASAKVAEAAMPDATRAHYAGRTTFCFVPDDRILTWDNARLGLG